MAQLLGQVAVGSIVKIKEDGVSKEFYVAKHDYESGLNGPGKSLIVRVKSHSMRRWHNDNINSFATSDILYWLNNTYKAKLDPKVSKLISPTTFYFTPKGPGQVSTFSSEFFLLSLKELGESDVYANSEGSTLPIAGTLKRAELEGNSFIGQWTRSPVTYGPSAAIQLNASGTPEELGCSYSSGARPVFTLPESMLVDDDGNIFVIETPTITTPETIMQGQPISVSWTAVNSADSYQLQRKVDSGEWTTVQTGAELTFEDTAGAWATVQYRVAAGISGTYGAYAEGEVITVISASALVISGKDEDLGTITNDIKFTVNTDTGNPITVKRYINDTLVEQIGVESGFARYIPVVDLPSGTGTVRLEANVQATSGPVSATRTWTYNKAPLSIPSAGAAAVLQQGGKNAFAATLAELVRVPAEYGGTLDKALARISGIIQPVTGVPLTVYAPAGSTITVVNGGTTLSGTATDGSWSTTLTSMGEWTITASLDGDTATKTLEVSEAKAYEITIEYISTTLNDNDWETIADVFAAGTAAARWSIGDTKDIIINGQVGSNGFFASNLKVSAILIGINHNSEKEGTGRGHFQIGKIDGKLIGLTDSMYGSSTGTGGHFNMNTVSNNINGWQSCQMRINIMGETVDGNASPSSPKENSLMAALPADLRAVMASVLKYTDNTGGGSVSPQNMSATTEYLCLLDEVEYLGARSYGNAAAPNYQKQYDYYKAGNSRIHYKHNEPSVPANVWCRGVNQSSSWDFCIITNGGGVASTAASQISYAISPAFFVGRAA